MAVEIIKNLTTQNFNAGTVSRIKYLVIHYTANDGDTALTNTNYFKSYRGSSAHYFVDEKSIYQSVEDKNIAWHCGANVYYHPECRNYNSLGIELCSYINSRGKYAFRAKTVENAVWLARQLMEKYSIPITRVIRHYDVTHKNCPEPYVRDAAAWEDFKRRIAEFEEDDEMVEKIVININGKDYAAERILKKDKNYICLQDFAQADFEIGYDVETKIPSIANKPKELNITVDGEETSVESVNIKGSNYVPIRSLAAATGAFEVDFKEGSVIVETRKIPGK